MFQVYILFSPSLQKFYVGSTEHLEIRFDEHNRGKSPFTKKGIPWRLIHQIECDSRIAAVQLENKIKKRGISRYLNDINFIMDRLSLQLSGGRSMIQNPPVKKNII